MDIKKDIGGLLKNLKISQLNELQEKCLVSYKYGDGMIVLSPTGTGKTLGFLLPLIQAIKVKNNIQILILAPTRELSLQIENVFRSMKTGLKVNCFYGGHSFKDEVNSLSVPPTVLIGTPGRIADHLRRKTISASNVSHLVLDEYDKILELGFINEIDSICGELINLEKSILTSATPLTQAPRTINLKKHKTLNFLDKRENTKLTIKKVIAEGTDKLEVLFELICEFKNETTLVFCNHRDAVERISQLLTQRKLAHGKFHGGLEQEKRERSLIKFRNGSSPILLTTDLAARGLDVPEIKNIIHYQLPNNEDTFIHRNGRTARMNANGTAYLVLAESEITPEFIPEIFEEVFPKTPPTLPNKPIWTTIYLGAGKKEKINKIDLVGFFCKKGGLDNKEIGLIEVKDHSAYIAINTEKAEFVLKTLRNEKIKNKKIKISLCR